MEELVSRIVEQIIQDLRDRPRLGYAWEHTNLEVQQNIRAAWTSIVREELRLYNASDEIGACVTRTEWLKNLRDGSRVAVVDAPNGTPSNRIIYHAIVRGHLPGRSTS